MRTAACYEREDDTSPDSLLLHWRFPQVFENMFQFNTKFPFPQLVFNLFPFFLHSYFLHSYFGSDSHVWHVSEPSKKGCRPKVRPWVKILKEIFLQTKYYQSFMQILNPRTTHNDCVRMDHSQKTEQNNLHIRQLGNQWSTKSRTLIFSTRWAHFKGRWKAGRVRRRPKILREEAHAARPWMRITLLSETQ